MYEQHYEQLACVKQCDTRRETSEALVLHSTSMACPCWRSARPARERSLAMSHDCPPLSASSTATGATLPSFGRFVYTRIPTATQDGEFSSHLASMFSLSSSLSCPSDIGWALGIVSEGTQNGVTHLTSLKSTSWMEYDR